MIHVYRDSSDLALLTLSFGGIASLLLPQGFFRCPFYLPATVADQEHLDPWVPHVLVSCEEADHRSPYHGQKNLARKITTPSPIPIANILLSCGQPCILHQPVQVFFPFCRLYVWAGVEQVEGRESFRWFPPWDVEQSPYGFSFRQADGVALFRPDYAL